MTPSRRATARAASFAGRRCRGHESTKKRTKNRKGIWQTAADANTNVAALTRSEGWARSTLDSVTMRQNDAVKVHFDVVFSRYKADGTKYATYQSLWIVTKKDDGWGVQARSSFAP